jgi:hypothetical protein
VKALAASADGVKLVGVMRRSGYSIAPLPAVVCVSSNNGATWTIGATSYWSSVASSADGTRMLAVSYASTYNLAVGPILYDGLIFASTNSGATWIQTGAPSNGWSSVASSADGTKLAAVSETYLVNGQIYSSLDSGATWTKARAPDNNWVSVASSADGSKLVAAAAAYWTGTNFAGENAIYTSLDSGATWTRTGAPSNYWSSVASSADGSRLGAATATDYHGLATSGIYTSSDFGATWRATTAPSNNWACVASSVDGTKLAAATACHGFGDQTYISTYSGTTWTLMTGGSGSCLASSADGSLIAAGGWFAIGVLSYAAPPSSIPPSPRLAIELSGGHPLLSWLVPSTSFVLQQSPDVAPPNWMDATNQPTLNFTSLHLETTLTPSSGNTFYRLKQP